VRGGGFDDFGGKMKNLISKRNFLLISSNISVIFTNSANETRKRGQGGGDKLFLEKIYTHVRGVNTA